MPRLQLHSSEYDPFVREVAFYTTAVQIDRFKTTCSLPINYEYGRGLGLLGVSWNVP